MRRPATPTERTCPVCGSIFQGVRRQKYCGVKCREKAIWQAVKARRRSAEDAIDAENVAAWKAEREQHEGQYLCYCVMCFRRFYSASPDTLYCSEVCMKLYGGKSMQYRIK